MSIGKDYARSAVQIHQAVVAKRKLNARNFLTGLVVGTGLCVAAFGGKSAINHFQQRAAECGESPISYMVDGGQCRPVKHTGNKASTPAPGK